MTLALMLILIVAALWVGLRVMKNQKIVSFRDENRSPSPQQQRVIELVSAGLTNRDVAERLGIDAHVVRKYLGMIYDKIGVSNRVELALWYEARSHEGKLPWRLR
jgi:DNA-binding CsgD family transcriptional regulator